MAAENRKAAGIVTIVALRNFIRFGIVPLALVLTGCSGGGGGSSSDDKLTSTSESSESEEVTSAALEAGLSVEISGDQADGGDCVEADDIVILLENS